MVSHKHGCVIDDGRRQELTKIKNKKSFIISAYYDTSPHVPDFINSSPPISRDDTRKDFSLLQG